MAEEVIGGQASKALLATQPAGITSNMMPGGGLFNKVAIAVRHAQVAHGVRPDFEAIDKAMMIPR